MANKPECAMGMFDDVDTANNEQDSEIEELQKTIKGLYFLNSFQIKTQIVECVTRYRKR